MMTDDVTTIAPDATAVPDDEARYTICFVMAVQAAKVYQLRIVEARARRGASVEALEADRDTLTDLEGGYTRALGRRRRDLGQVLGARRGAAYEVVEVKGVSRG